MKQVLYRWVCDICYKESLKESKGPPIDWAHYTEDEKEKHACWRCVEFSGHGVKFNPFP